MPELDVPATLIEAFRRSARLGPDRPFLEHEGVVWSWGEVEERVSRIAGALRASGIALRSNGGRHGERVALFLPNGLPFVETYLAVLWAGGVAVPVNTRYRRTELTHILGHSGARLVVCDRAGLAHLDEVPPDASSRPPARLVVEGPEGSLDAWATMGPTSPSEPVPGGPDALAVIGYTSGTTGRAKGAMLPHGAFFANARAVTAAWGWTRDDRLLLAVPLFHMHGLGVGLHGTLIAGSSLLLKTRFEPSEVWDDLVAGRATMLFGVPTMHARLASEGKRRGGRPQGLRLLVSGSAPLSPDTFHEVEEVLGQAPLERYGMTETVMNTGNPLDGPRRPGSVGFPFQGVEVRVVHPRTLEPLPTGETGEVLVRGPNVFAGYWNDEAATAEAFTEDRWFRTGDLGLLLADGALVLNGRARELIITGGFNVYPREVEEVLEAHPRVAEAAVLGLPDPDLGERVVAAVVPRETVTSEELEAHCASLLAGFKKPREVRFLEELPRNALGKVQKHVLRESLRRTS